MCLWALTTVPLPSGGEDADVKTTNAILLATGMFWLGLIFGSESFGDIVWLGVAGTVGLLLAAGVTELISSRRRTVPGAR